MPYRRKPDGFKGIQKPRFRKDDYFDRMPEIASLLSQAALELWTDGVALDFIDNEYRSFILVEILHGDQWRRNKTLHTLEDAKRHILEVCESHRVKYEARLAAALADDGVDRRMNLYKKDSQTVKHKGVNFKIYGDEAK